jgi:isoleucyl-tRNA synthetase
VLEVLTENGRLLAQAPLKHSYMHCWRHKTPIIYRATTQWFVGMDRKTRSPRQGDGEKGRHAARAPGAKARLHAMIANRPDWCVSRQRNWGVPIPFFLHKETGELHPRTLELIEAVARASSRKASTPGSSSTPPNCSATKPPVRQDERHARRLVRFRHHARTCCAARTGDDLAHPRPTSTSKARTSIAAGSIPALLTGCAIDGRAPYKALLTHGFVVDGKGMKMSKSKGNVVAPQEVSDTLGAEILRLWVASHRLLGRAVDLQGESSTRVVEVYRRLRNTLRFLLANTADFDPSRRRCCRSSNGWRSTATRWP